LLGEAGSLGRQDIVTARGELARYLAAGWLVKVHVEATSRRAGFSLPEEARKLGLVPSWSSRSPSYVVAVALGETLEVWPSEQWTRYQRTLELDLEVLVGELREDD